MLQRLSEYKLRQGTPPSLPYAKSADFAYGKATQHNPKQFSQSDSNLLFKKKLPINYCCKNQKSITLPFITTSIYSFEKPHNPQLQ